jgi:Uncharacterized conserved protein (some members contain a von Willebrand factor type A (vWA) domain)
VSAADRTGPSAAAPHGREREDRGQPVSRGARVRPGDALLRGVERLAVASSGRTRGTRQGKRRSGALGSSLEFADYRAYVPGDDFRRLDWNVYGRTGRAYIRQYWDEQETDVTFYLDVSRSMRFEPGKPDAGPDEWRDANKLLYAARIAACAGYAALCGDDRAAAVRFASGVVDRLPPVRGRGAAGRLFEFFEQSLQPAADPGAEDLRVPLASPGALPPRPGVSWLLTDGLYASGIEETLTAFAAARQHLVFMHVLGPDEWHPQLRGELRLIDAETEAAKEVAIHENALKAYGEALREHIAAIRRRCAELGFVYFAVDTSVPVEETVLVRMARHGLLQRPR